MATTPSWISVQRERRSWEPSGNHLLCALESCLCCIFLELLLELLFYVNQVPQSLGDGYKNKHCTTQSIIQHSGSTSTFLISKHVLQEKQHTLYILACLRRLCGREVGPVRLCSNPSCWCWKHCCWEIWLRKLSSPFLNARSLDF